MPLVVHPFDSGLKEENDGRLRAPGTPRAVEELIRTKNGRLRVRHDYETIANTETGGIANLTLHDLHQFENRLLAIGHDDLGILDLTPQRGATAVFELIELPGGNWRRSNQSELSPATQVRHVGALGKQDTPVSVMDMAAGAGLVCEVYDVELAAGGFRSIVHIFDPNTDTTIRFFEDSGLSQPRVVFCASSFFITRVVTATGEITLLQYDTTTGATTVLTSPVAAVATIDAYDFATSHEGTTMWIAAARSNTTTALRGMNSAGTVTYTAAGPAVLYDSLSILVHSTVAATQRLHILGVRDTTGTMDLVTYLPPATAPATTSNNIFTPGTSNRQASLAVRELAASATTEIVALWGEDDAAGFGTYTRIYWRPVDAVTHALGVEEVRIGFLASKIRNIDSVLAFGLLIQEGTDQFTNCLGHIFRSSRFLVRPVTVVDRLIAAAPSAFHLPSLSRDASTSLSYWAHFTETIDGNGQPRVTEMKLNATDRRQSTEIGAALYIAGGIMHVFDRRCVGEAGGFLTRPFIYAIQPQNSGALTLDGIYQLSSKFELNDSLDRRVQSAPSEVIEIDLSAVEDEIQAISSGVFSYWDHTEADSTPNAQRATPFIVTYRTQDTAGGQITFHLDVSEVINAPWQGATPPAVLVQSDVAISDNEVLYTQGARGALSGPLEFVTPDPCTTLAASASRVLSGGLPRDSSMQESRELLVGEQVQWSDSIGFYRDVRGRIFAVARLDERRILYAEREIFEADGPGLDDNGGGDIGAPRRLPSDVGLYGGVLGWRSMVEISAGILFQGLVNQIYLLPRGGVTPVPIGFSIEDKLTAYPVISAAVYMNEDQTVRFCCNNVAGTESIVLLLNVRFMEWFVEGPYAFTIRSAARADGRFYLLTSLNTVLRQRVEDTPLTFIDYAWRSSVEHPFKPGMFGRFLAPWIYGTVRSEFSVRARVTFDEDPATLAVHDWVDVVGKEVGSQFRFRFEFEQVKCESVQVDFEFTNFQGRAGSGLDLTYWAIEVDPSNVPNQVEPESMT